MIAEQKSDKDWQGPSKESTEDVGNDTLSGIATESQGREDNPDLYEQDVLGIVARRDKDSIWKRGNEKRTKHRKEE
nr:hypothetical protein WMHIBSEC_WMHIBSEC_CDS_0072 [Caudoviricetes sp.]CAI9751829.1 hypothetical protein AZFZUZMX_AZFZUZMX_CDS_0072 [Caudoviricetes sp.]